MERDGATYIAKPRVGPSGFKLVVHFHGPNIGGWNGGLFFQHEAPSGRGTPQRHPGVGHQVMSWDEWDKLVEWVQQRRAEAAERLRADYERQMTVLEKS
jgi:hypothetical protein